jgi:type II secretory pathway pseudopilin PulG
MVELLLVVVIVGGLAAVVWPRFARLARSLTVRTAARDLVGLVARARLEALSRREPVELRMEPGTVTMSRLQARYERAERLAKAAPTEGRLLEYSLSARATIDRLQVLPAQRTPVPGEPEGGADARAREDGSDEGVAITFYADGTSDDALIGVGESGNADDEAEYYVRVRGLVARATVLRWLPPSDEQLFSEVADGALDW